MTSPAQIQRLFKDAIAHHNANRLGKAEAIYRQIRVALPNNFDALHLSGLVALQQGRHADAVDLLGKALRLDTRSAECAMRLGLALNSSGRNAEAEERLRQAVELNPGYAEGWVNLAFCLRTLDRLADAIVCHEKALSLNPASAPIAYNLGLTLNLAGQIGRALG